MVRDAQERDRQITDGIRPSSVIQPPPVETEAAAERNGVATGLERALRELPRVLSKLTAVLERRPESKPPVDRLALRIDELADALGVSRRALDRERSAGRLPKPDLHIGKMPLWRIETVHHWLASGGSHK
jgi:hypothetical protein